MTTVLPKEELARELLRQDLLQAEERDLAEEHPAFLLHHVKCVDSRSGDVFQFQLLTPEECALIQRECPYMALPPAERETPIGEKDWHWQRDLLDWILVEDQTVVLKGRQLGVTWVACGLALWYLLYKPGTDVLIYSIGEDEAKEVVERIWGMYLSVPQHLLNGVRLVTPSRGKPSTVIKVEHTLPDGSTKISAIEAMPATPNAGHSRSAALVIFDEVARNKYARPIWKAVIPASGDRGGKITAISTACGMSDEKTGDGNWFHYLCVKAGTVVFPRLKTRFLGWWLHPDRDQEWYDNIGLDPADKAEQYPNDPEEAFLLSGQPYFDFEALKHYSRQKVKPLFQARFELFPSQPNKAKLIKADGAPITVYRLPVKGRDYGLAADIATGSGTDFSVGAVIDLSTAEPVAELYMHGDYEAFTDQLHFLGLWYNGARIAVEKGGGYGDTVIAYLRDGLKGRRPYSRLYRHRKFDRADRAESRTLGFPMNQQTRPKVVSELRNWINGRLLPYMTENLLRESRTFVHRDTRPSPRAADGTNDDAVMAWGIALELYAQFGEHEHDRRKQTRSKLKKKSKPLYPWQT